MFAYFKEEIPVFRYLLFFICGVAAAINIDVKIQQWLILLWLSLFLLLALNLYVSRKTKFFSTQIPAAIILFLIFLSGFIITNQRKELENPKHFSKHISEQLLVTVYEIPKIKGDVARFFVKVKAVINNNKIEPATGNLLLAMRFDTLKTFNYVYGDQLIIASKFTDTEPAYNPAEFNYKRHLSYQQIFYQSFINLKQSVKIDSNQANPIIAFALSFREKQVLKFKQHIDSKDAQAVASTLILGYRADLSQDILDAYSKIGTMHVLSVSGMHVAIVVLLLNLLLRPLDRNKYSKLFKLLLMIFLIWFYSLICGLAPSILRAALMLTFLLIAKYKSKRVNIFNIISIAAFIILLIDPYDLMDVGFQLSFLAVIGLVYLQPLIYRIYQPENKIIDWAWQLISVSTAAQIATSPISLYYFHQFPVYFLISNLFIAMPATIIMYSGLAFLLLSSISFCSKWLGYLLEVSITLTNKGLTILEHIPYANITQIWVTKLEIVLCYLLILILLSVQKNITWLRVAFILLLMITVVHTYHTFNHQKQHKVVFFSLRKNTAVAYIKGTRAILLTDLDTNEYSFKFSVKPYLDSCRISNINYINPHLSASENIYHLDKHRLKIINHKYQNYLATKSDYLLLSTDRKLSLPKLLSNNPTQLLLIDGRNRDFIIEDLENQALRAGLKVAILKRHRAQEINF